MKFGGVFVLFHVGALIFRPNPCRNKSPETHPGRGHALEVFRLDHPLVARGLVIEMVARRYRKSNVHCVSQVMPLSCSFFLPGAAFPARLRLGIRRRGQTRRELPQTRRSEESGETTPAWEKYVHS